MRFIKKFEELNTDTIRSAAREMDKRGQSRRANNLINILLNDFKDRELCRYTIKDIKYTFRYDKDIFYLILSQGDYKQTYLYDYSNDVWCVGSLGVKLSTVPSRTDASLLSRIAKTINPETKITPHIFMIEDYR